MTRMRNGNMNGLQFQMQEREVQKQIKDISDRRFAEDVRMKVLNEQQLEE
jgi:hypothetical protein